MAIGNCIGEVKILNLKSGGVLYTLPHDGYEITCLQFLSGLSEFWLLGGSWQGRLMMWTCPNEDNNFTVNGKCRIGHKDDILCVDASSQYFATGGVDGLLSIWNSFSGILKYSIEMPPPSASDQTSSHIKQTVVGVFFHPYNSNLVCVMQEGGDIHIIDASNGNIAYEYVAQARLNSNWACDRQTGRVLVVGDMGQA